MSSTESEPVRLTADAKLSVYGCKIRRDQLNRIWALAKEGFPPGADIRISTDRKHGGVSTTISGTTIDEVLDGLQRSTLPGDPNSLDNLALSISQWENRVSRKVDIYITPRGVDVRLRGSDPEWVRGRIGGLKDLFFETRPKGVVGVGFSRWLLTMMAALLGTIVGFPLALVIPDRFLASLSFPVAIIMFSWLGNLIGWYLDKRAKVELSLFPAAPAQGRDWMNISMLAATLATVVIAVIAIAVAHYDATASSLK